MAKWYVSAKKADFAAIGAKFGIDQVTARIIRNRGVIGDDAVNEFLNGKISDIADPALLKDGQRLVEILAQKIADSVYPVLICLVNQSEGWLWFECASD